MKNNYKIIDDVISISYQNLIENEFNSNNFPYYFNDTINNNIEDNIYTDKRITNAYGLSHTIYNCETKLINSNYYFLVLPILFSLEEKINIQIKEIKRIRVRRTTQNPNHNLEKFNPPHVDLAELEPYYSLVYYVEDSDGDTILFNKEYKNNEVFKSDNEKILFRIPPKKGRGLFFKGKIYHSGNCPVKYIKRTIINFDFSIK
jgi:hypothetical protein